MSPPPALLIAAARLRVDEIAARSSAFRDRVRGLSQLLLERINSSRLGRELVHPALHCVPEEEVERVQIGTALRELHGDDSQILLRRESFVGLLASGVVVLERPVGALVAVNNLQRPLEKAAACTFRFSTARRIRKAVSTLDLASQDACAHVDKTSRVYLAFSHLAL